MYSTQDTIAAISSPAGTDAIRTIVRVSGSCAFAICNSLYRGPALPSRGITKGTLTVDCDLAVDVIVYTFTSPASYTGDDLVELHIYAAAPVVEELIKQIFAAGARLAGPGEFTAHAYLNGKIDIAQAEAISRIISSSNMLQLCASQRLLDGRLHRELEIAKNELIDIVSLIEAGLDFSTEDIEFISRDQAIGRISKIESRLGQLLDANTSCSELARMPSVGIIGMPNAGKSSLLNALTCKARSIVSDQPATTRDVLTEVLRLEHCSCAIFDCAGLMHKPETLLDALAQNAALQAAKSANCNIFCFDLTKSAWHEDLEILNLAFSPRIIFVATKTDQLDEISCMVKIAALESILNRSVLPVSSTNLIGIADLKAALNNLLSGAASPESADAISLNQRHITWLKDALANLAQSREAIGSGNEEIAAMLLRNSYRAFSEIWDQPLDDAVLERIFSRFCIGK